MEISYGEINKKKRKSKYNPYLDEVKVSYWYVIVWRDTIV